jgi:DNA-binding transcriptional regulator WhiA
MVMNTVKDQVWELLQVKVMRRKYSDEQIAKMVKPKVTRQYVNKLRRMWRDKDLVDKGKQ